ncbi:MAG: hypothetical protein ACI3ZD_17585 [Prevotella sp.]
MKERLKAALGELQGILEELQSRENEFASKKGDWYQRNIMLNYSGLIDDTEFVAEVWNVNHEQLSESFGSSISTLQWSMNGFLEQYDSFERVCKRLDNLLANEKDRVPKGCKAYKVMYYEKGCSCEQEFYCYANYQSEAELLCRTVNGNDVLRIKKTEEAGL